MSEHLTHDVFARNLKSKFRVVIDDTRSVEAELTEVSDLLVSDRQERFSVLFRMPREPHLGQGLWRFDHDEIGPFELFIVPVGQNEQGTTYEAIFNRLVEAK